MCERDAGDGIEKDQKKSLKSAKTIRLANKFECRKLEFRGEGLKNQGLLAPDAGVLLPPVPIKFISDW